MSSMLNLARWLCLSGALLLLAPPLFGQVATTDRALPLGVQACDTLCQSNETDCDLACDQVVACVEECKKASGGCVQKCREATPKSKPEAPENKPAGKPGAAADKKAPPGKAPPGKAPPGKAAAPKVAPKPSPKP